MLAVQTDIYSDMDQEFGQRLAYAIDHTDGVDARLRQAADLMRSWDGRLDDRLRRRFARDAGSTRAVAADSGAEAGQGGR